MAAQRNPRFSRFWGKPKPLAVADLKVGDIMLIHSRHETVRNAVGGLLTGSPFSHAAVYVGNGKFVDMRVKGTKRIAAEAILRYYTSPFIFRAKLSPVQQTAIAKNANAMIGVPFSRSVARIIRVNEVAGIKIKNPKKEGYACSSMVADAFHQAGVELVPGISPLRVGLSHLMKSKKLEAIN